MYYYMGGEDLLWVQGFRYVLRSVDNGVATSFLNLANLHKWIRLKPNGEKK